jgi:hypothetical protein
MRLILFVRNPKAVFVGIWSVGERILQPENLLCMNTTGINKSQM